MLILRRKEGDWTEVRHKSGDVLWVRVYNLRGRDGRGQADVAFDDAAHNFLIERPERVTTPELKKGA